MRYTVERSTHTEDRLAPSGSFDRPDHLACFDVVDTLPPRRLLAQRLRRVDAEAIATAMNNSFEYSIP